MNIVLLIVATLCAAMSMAAQSTTIPLTFRNQIPSTVNTRTHTIGIQDSATVGYDEQLGEIEIPPFPLPGGIFFVWSVVPTQETVWLSPLDLRPRQTNQTWSDTFNIRVSWSGGTLDVSWPEARPEGIDSAYLVDAFSDFPNNIVKAKLWTSDVFSTANPAIDRFRCIVWWNTTNTSVTDNHQSNLVSTVFPNPASSSLSIQSVASSYMMLDVMGRLVLQGALVNGTANLDVSHLPSGAYFVRLATPTSVENRAIVIE